MKTAVAEAAESALFGRVGALGASELANALLGGGNPYAPTGPAQQPEDVDRENGSTVHGAAVADPQPDAKAAADAPIVKVLPEASATDPLQQAAERSRASGRDLGTSRQPEIG